MIKAFCRKKTIWIKDGKAVNYCVKIKCIWLSFKIRKIEKKIRRRKNERVLQV